MLPVAVNAPVFGSKISAVDRVEAAVSSVPRPPTTRTRPSARRVAVWRLRPTVIAGPAEKVPLTGS